MQTLELDPALLDALRRATRVAVLTGAGVSAESGVPTFRDALTGLWATFDPQRLATPEAFLRDPALVWRWYAERRARVAAVQPNPGHFALVAMATRYADFTLVTQNVDGLHLRAGSRDVVELHGNLARVKCFDGCGVVDAWDERETPPRCRCGAPLRPDVVWFGEPLPAEAIARAQQAARRAEVFFSVGTSGEVFPAAELPRIARAAGALVVEVNPDATPLSPLARFALRGPAGVVLPRLLAALG